MSSTPPRRSGRTVSPRQESGLSAKAISAGRSAGTKSALDTRSHRTARQRQRRTLLVSLLERVRRRRGGSAKPSIVRTPLGKFLKKLESWKTWSRGAAVTAEGQLQGSFFTIFSACSAPPRDIEVPKCARSFRCRPVSVVRSFPFPIGCALLGHPSTSVPRSPEISEEPTKKVDQIRARAIVGCW